ncbi:hypothetical protein KVT40_001134 [Elsinoe batatas]|uniref:Zn(2)-C6 fungal-type domain-containing protein n=1 Tax=Elsinoe batatas TaxID=2601811 RepID=A0A8K0PNB4_9PEZI|nr:hypothetical protein KVT40_001134 [Elsinoe batatas]
MIHEAVALRIITAKAAKSKCDRKAERCSRCVDKVLLCVYTIKANNGQVQETASTIRPGSTPNCYDGGTWSDADPAQRPSFQDLDLFCPIPADQIRNRWMNPYLVEGSQHVKTISANAAVFLQRILESYIGVIRRDVVPDFIHPMQTHQASPVLTTCLELVRSCARMLPADLNSIKASLLEAMADTTTRAENTSSLDALSAFQAMLIYCMVLDLWFDGSGVQLCEATIRLQEIASWSCKKGLECTSIGTNDRPEWAEWIVVEAKRRTLYTMYLFDNMLSSRNDLPSFISEELSGLRAPGGNDLWRASERKDWIKAYDDSMREWQDKPLQINELWPLPADSSESEHRRQSERIEKWLEQADEYCIMLYAMTSSLHGV